MSEHMSKIKKGLPAITPMKADYKQTEIGVIPEDWEVGFFSGICEKIQDGTHFSPKQGGNDYFYVTSKNIRFGFLDLSNVDQIDAFQHSVIYRRCGVRCGDLLLTKDGANTGNAAINTLSEEFSLLSSVAFLRFDSKRYSAQYFLQQILSQYGQNQIKEAMSGNAITRLTLKKINKLSFPFPQVSEQKSIAEVLSDTDALIEKLTQLIVKKKNIKQATMQQLLTSKKRLAGFSKKWEQVSLGLLLDYKQPTKYLVSSTEYNNAFDIPVLTVGKTFVLGYTNEEYGVFDDLPCIIFDDFTTQSRYVDFPFKAKSSAMKMLLPKSETENLRFIFEQMQQIKFNLKDHKRYWISEYKNIEIDLPEPKEQDAIVAVLSDMDTEIEALEKEKAKYQAIKQGMMQSLLTGHIRLLTH
jgi:type I restriction enzyme S subunit